MLGIQFQRYPVALVHIVGHELLHIFNIVDLSCCYYAGRAVTVVVLAIERAAVGREADGPQVAIANNVGAAHAAVAHQGGKCLGDVGLAVGRR